MTLFDVRIDYRIGAVKILHCCVVGGISHEHCYIFSKKALHKINLKLVKSITLKPYKEIK